MKIYLVLVLILSSALIVGQPSFTETNYPPPGRLVDLGSRKLHMIVSGKGSPTIVLIAGAGAYAIDWTLVQSRLDSNSRVISYDRAGLGWSDPGKGEDIVEEVINDLHNMLEISGEKGPYILVGASVGGIFAQAFQHAYPKQVAGIVFSNSSDRIDMSTKSRSGLIWELSEDEITSKFPILPSSAKREPAKRVRKPFDRLPDSLQPQRLWLDERLQQGWDTTVAEATGVLSWRRELLREFTQSEAAKGSYPLGKLPVVVVSSQPKKHDSMRYSRSGAAARLDYLSSNSIHLTADGSGHEIHLYQPDTVVKAVRMLLIAVRKKIPLSQFNTYGVRF